MANTTESAPSFSRRQRWGIALHVGLSSLAVLAVVVLLNYLGRDCFFRFHCSSRAGAQLSPLTLRFVHSITNAVKVTLFYDRDEPLFSTVAELLNQYHLANSHILVQAVDYNRDPGAGLKVRDNYKQLLPGQKDVVIFDCGGKTMIYPGAALTKVVWEEVPNEKDRDLDRRKLTEFEGERVFTSLLIAVTSPTRPKAYFLQGHHEEHPLLSGDSVGYVQFLTVLRQNNIEVEAIDLVGANLIPADCRLLIIAGARTPLADAELDKIDRYLNEGGRLLALFKSQGMSQQTGEVPATGLESILAKWGVEVGRRVILDPQNSPGKGYDFIVSGFSGTHPVVNPLIEQGGLQIMPPRPIAKLKVPMQGPDTFRVDEIAFTSPGAFMVGDPTHKRMFPVMAAVDATIKGVTTERGSTRLLVAGDSFFLDNQLISHADNRGFVSYAANWLLDRVQLIDAIDARPVRKYRIIMTRGQLQTTQLLLMGALPGSAVLLGGLVWLRRRR